MSIPEHHFGNNLMRLLGMHRLPAQAGRYLFHLSPQAISDLSYGKREPSLSTAQSVSTFFQIPIDRLLNASFGELLETDLASAERFRKVEAEIERKRARLPRTTHGRAWSTAKEPRVRPDPSAPT